MRGSAAWTALAGIAWLVTLVATMFLALALWVGVDQGIQIMRGKAEFASVGFGKGVLTVLVLTVILCASVWVIAHRKSCLLYTSPSPRDRQKSRMPSSA